MKKYLLILFMLLILFNFGCQKEDVEPDVFQVEVLEKGLDCGDLFLIQFDEQDENRLKKYLKNTYSLFPVFYADNLIEEHKERELFLHVTLEKCNTENSYPFACTMLGPTYSHVCIKTSEPVSIAFP